MGSIVMFICGLLDVSCFRRGQVVIETPITVKQNSLQLNKLSDRCAIFALCFESTNPHSYHSHHKKAIKSIFLSSFLERVDLLTSNCSSADSTSVI